MNTHVLNTNPHGQAIDYVPQSTVAWGDALDELPPADQDRLAQILDSYLEDWQRGSCRSADELIALHPDLADPLRRYLGSMNLLQQAAAVCHTKAAPATPAQLGDFQILGEIGRGGMGIVYQARQVSLGRLVALKVLPFAAVLDPKQVARFQNEAQAAAQLHHPHIVPVYGVGCERGVHYYSMQFIDGQSLDRAMLELKSTQAGAKTVPLSRGSLGSSGDSRTPEATACRFTTQRSIRNRNYVSSAVKLIIDAAEALHYAHECGIIHRDVKPSNLMVDCHGEVWVTDFGLARCQHLSNLTAPGDFFGTITYMSPEQAAGHMALVDHRSDIYSLGVTLYELLTLQAPFESAERAKLVRMILESEPTSPRGLNPSIPLDLETILLKTLSKAREDRYATAADFAADLQRYLDGEPTQARRPNVLDRVAKWVSRHAKGVAAGSIVALLATVVISVSAILLASEQQRTKQALEEAEISLGAAHGVVDELCAELSEDLALIPGTEPVRLKALENAQRFYRDFAKYAADEPRWQRDVATAGFKRGAVLEKLGRNADALTCYQEARTLFTTLAASNPNEPTLPAQAALCENNRGLIQCREQHRDGIRSLRNAEAELDTLSARFPSEQSIREDLCLVRLNLGLELNKIGQQDEARRFISNSVTYARESVSRSPENRLMARRLAIGLGHLGNMELNRQAALRALQESVALHRVLAGREPDRVAHQSALATTLNHLGAAHAKLNDVEFARRQFEESLVISRRIVSRSPTIARFRTELAAGLNNLGMTYLDTDPAAAAGMFGEAADLMRELVGKSPADYALRSELATAINNCGLVSARQGKLQEAVSAFRQAVAEQELVLARGPDIGTHREQLEKMNANLNRALEASQRSAPETNLGASRDSSSSPVAHIGKAT